MDHFEVIRAYGTSDLCIRGWIRTVREVYYSGLYVSVQLVIWVWVNTYRYIFSGMNIHLPAILGFTRYQGFDPSS